MKRTLFFVVLLSCQCMASLVFAQSQPAGSQDQAIKELLAQSAAREAATVQQSTGAAEPANTSEPAQATSSHHAEDRLGSNPDARIAFSKMVKQLLPLSNEQLSTLKSMMDKSARTSALYPGVPPRETASSLLVNLSPGATPPLIRLRLGYVSSLLFIDSTGQPWPVVGYDLGNPKAFNIQWDQQHNASALMVQAVAGYNTGNIVVMLKGLSIPVVLSFIPGQKAVDYLSYVRVPGFGPNASPELRHLPQQASPELMSVLNGIPPVRSKRVEVLGGEAQAWLVNSVLYLRTRLTLLSPSWVSTLSTPDGMHAYTLSKTPLLLASDRGHMVKLIIRGL